MGGKKEYLKGERTLDEKLPPTLQKKPKPGARNAEQRSKGPLNSRLKGVEKLDETCNRPWAKNGRRIVGATRGNRPSSNAGLLGGKRNGADFLCEGETKKTLHQ